MTRLRIDTWDPEYGSSFEAMETIDDTATLGQIEATEWTPVKPVPRNPLPRIGFVDGVRRIDARLFAEDSSGVAPALAGSWAVGVAWADRPPTVGPIRVGRLLVVGGGLSHVDLLVNIGSARLVYELTSVAGRDPADPVQGLQNAMRLAESDLAGDVLGASKADLFVLDGPLSYFAPAGSVVGMVKRQTRPYLNADQAGILGRLDVGERTPIFLIEDQRLERFSWYTRIGPRRPIDGFMTGIVRLETSVAMGAERAGQLADVTATILPRFATEWGRDPRAPQNLYPVAQLERDLHHRLGDQIMIKRSIESALWGDNA